MFDPHNFNSSDIEAPEEKPDCLYRKDGTKRRSKAIESMMTMTDEERKAEEEGWLRFKESLDRAEALKDNRRKTSRLAYTRLRSHTGAYSSQLAQAMWWRRFMEFRRDLLHRDVTKPFKGPEVVRFFDSIIDNMKDHNGGPIHDKCIIRADEMVLKLVSPVYQDCEHKWGWYDDWNFEKWTETAAIHERLSEELQQPKEYFQFCVVTQLIATLLEDSLINGCTSWDGVLQLCLLISMAFSLPASKDNGLPNTVDILVNLRWEHIRMWLDGVDANVEQTEEYLLSCLKVSVRVCRVENHESTVQLKPLDNPEFAHVNPMAHLIINAIRLDQTPCKGAGEFLRGIAQSDGCAQWPHPGRPLFVSMTQAKTVIDIDKPANVGDAATALERVAARIHAMARVYFDPLGGAARDVYRTPVTKIDAHVLAMEVRGQDLHELPEVTSIDRTDRHDKRLGEAPQSGGSSAPRDTKRAKLSVNDDVSTERSETKSSALAPKNLEDTPRPVGPSEGVKNEESQEPSFCSDNYDDDELPADPHLFKLDDSHQDADAKLVVQVVFQTGNADGHEDAQSKKWAAFVAPVPLIPGSVAYAPTMTEFIDRYAQIKKVGNDQ